MLAFTTLAITDRRSIATPLAEWLAAAIRVLPAIQLREKDLPDGAVFDLLAAAQRTEGASARLLVNGRVDLAIAAGVAGVHLPVSGLPVSAIRSRFGEELVVGCSTHHLAEVERAAEEGADYVTFGPVYATPSKARLGPPKGPEALAEATAVGLPVLALGGVTVERFEELEESGAAGVAGIRLFSDPLGWETVLRKAETVFGDP